MSAGWPAVTVAVLTYRREAMLAQLLRELVRQVNGLDGGDASTVLVVDNDPTESARSIAEAAGPAVRYVVERTPGIAAARQCALDNVPGDDLLVFIDDDETPTTEWLNLLVRAWANTGRPAGVAGRVVPKYEVPPDPWIEAGRFFVRRSLPTGTPVDAAGAGNLLLDLTQVRALGLRFETSLGMRGGEDTLFTRQLTKRGGRIIWCEEAQAADLVPRTRANRQWVLRRGFSHGSAHAMVMVRLEDHPPRRLLTRAILVGGGVARIVAGLLKHLWARLRGHLGDEARGLWLAWRGAGVISGAVGIGWDEYARKADPEPHSHR